MLFYSPVLREPFARDTFNRYLIWPEPEMVAFGAKVRRGRELAHLTQRQVAAKSGVSQSVISRFERGLAPGMTVERFWRIATAIGPRLPLGVCPHEHDCIWSRPDRPSRPADDPHVQRRTTLF